MNAVTPYWGGRSDDDFGRNGSTLCSLSQCILGSAEFPRCWSAPVWIKSGQWNGVGTAANRKLNNNGTTSRNKINRVTKRGSRRSERTLRDDTGLVFKSSFFFFSFFFSVQSVSILNLHTLILAHFLHTNTFQAHTGSSLHVLSIRAETKTQIRMDFWLDLNIVSRRNSWSVHLSSQLSHLSFIIQVPLSLCVQLTQATPCMRKCILILSHTQTSTHTLFMNRRSSLGCLSWRFSSGAPGCPPRPAPAPFSLLHSA